MKLDFEQMYSVACEYRQAECEFRQYHARKYGYPVMYGTDPHHDWLFEQAEKTANALYMVSKITGIPSKVLLDVSRIVDGYEARNNYDRLLCRGTDDYEELIRCLDEQKEQRCGIYSNEYCDRAIARIDYERYEKTGRWY